MICDICGKKKATVHLTEIVDEQMSEMHLCEECARQKSSQMEQQFGIADLLAGLADTPKSASLKDSDKSPLQCTRCHLPYEDFRKFGRLGCGECYTSFKDHLSGLLRKIHGSNKYLGKTPLSFQEKPAVASTEAPTASLALADGLEDLKQQLQSAIAAEDFERAAILRDKIRQMEQK